MRKETCIECENSHKDYRSASGHLTLDPQTGATILEPHVTYPSNGHAHGHGDLTLCFIVHPGP